MCKLNSRLKVKREASMEAGTVKTYGAFQQDMSPHSQEHLALFFSPSHVPIGKRWESNGLSADYIADYFRSLYVNNNDKDKQVLDEITLSNLYDAIKYVSNELLENAMKFQDERIQSSAEIFLSLHTYELIFCVTNGVSQQQAQRLRKHIEKILHSDPQEVYFETMRNSIKEENQEESGLGLLSMICDYEANVGWKFEYYPDKTLVSTMVTLHMVSQQDISTTPNGE